MTLSNLVAWCIQVTIVAAGCAALPYLFHLQLSRARLWYWHVVLLACLALPLLQPWMKPEPGRSNVTFTTGQFRVATDQTSSGLNITLPAVAFTVLSGGIVLRLLWLSVGLLRLRRYRATAIPLELADDHFVDLRRTIAPQAEILVSSHVATPVTFGVWNAVVLLPDRFRDLGLDELRSIVCHELIHIQRRDWAAAIGEELVRSIVWFHPAVWWLLGQIQLTREQVVDEAVIECTGDRKRYLDALLAIASLRFSADLAPAPLFLKKRHLRQRVESIVSGVTMTKRNLLLPLAAALATLPVVIGIAAWQFPLRAAPQEAVDDPGIEVQLGAAKILHRTGIPFPDEARARHLSGTVVTNITVDDQGGVIGAQAASGPDELRRPVIQSITNWHFVLDSTSAPHSFEVAVRFDGSQAPLPTHRGESSLVPPTAPDVPRTIDSVNLAMLPVALRDKVSQSGLLHVGDVITRDSFKTVEASLRNLDDHLRVTGSLEGDRIHVMVRLDTAGPGPNRVANDATPSGETPKSIRVGGNVQSANLINKVAPLYPPEAKQARIQGTVKLNVVIGPDGLVKNVEVISGHPLLVPSAMDAVKDWVYKPTLLNGNPVEVITTVDINFTLTQ
jgi:TonB family protein